MQRGQGLTLVRQRRSFGKYVSFIFLDEAHLLVTSNLQENLEIYHIPSTPSSGLHDASSVVTDQDPFLILELPLGAFRCWVHQDDRHRVHSSSPDSRAPFHPDPALAITAVRFSIYNPELSASVLLVPGATFQTQIDAAHAASPDAGATTAGNTGTRRVFWHEWGPEGSLLVNVAGADDASRPAFGSPCGARFPVLVHDRRDKASVRVVILDLSPWAVREAQTQGSARGGGPGSEGRDRLVPLKDLGGLQVRSPRANVPHVAYGGPRLTFPEGHKPTAVAMTQTGFTVLARTIGLLAGCAPHLSFAA